MRPQRGVSFVVGVFAASNLATAADDPASVLMRRALGPSPILEDLRQLTDTIGAFIDSWNDHHPFAWTKDADEILASINRAKTKTSRLTDH